MISERKFSKSYSSFWNQLLPTSEVFVRTLNLSLERYCLPLESISPADRDKRALINELAFRLFNAKIAGKDMTSSLIKDLEKETRIYIERLSKSNKVKLLTRNELQESKELLYSLESFFKNDDFSRLKFWPSFKGCGIIHSCKGDIILDNTLIEVKAGDRHFRVIDIRQIITYLSLNFYSKEYEIENIVLLNPRTGMKFETSIDDFFEACSGKNPVDIYSEINEYISIELVSK